MNFRKTPYIFPTRNQSSLLNVEQRDHAQVKNKVKSKVFNRNSFFAYKDNFSR